MCDECCYFFQYQQLDTSANTNQRHTLNQNGCNNGRHGNVHLRRPSPDSKGGHATDHRVAVTSLPPAPTTPTSPSHPSYNGPSSAMVGGGGGGGGDTELMTRLRARRVMLDRLETRRKGLASSWASTDICSPREEGGGYFQRNILKIRQRLNYIFLFSEGSGRGIHKEHLF